MTLRAAALIGLLACAGCATVAPPQPQPQPLATGVTLVPGGFLPGRQPDGNTVIFEAPTGLVVFDTGRHAWHGDAILAFARERRRPVVAIVNSHWHLDHTSGNEAIRAAYPHARVYASDALARIERDVWPKSTADLQAYLASGKASAEVAEDLRSDIHAQTHPAPMRADVVVASSGARDVGGLPLELHLARHAATDGDVWVFDPRTRVLAAGDLVTLPVPFLDTACLAGWQAALAEVESTPFDTLVPGHGAQMTRAQFQSWRRALDRFGACAGSADDKARCAAQWLDDTAQAGDERARGMAAYYVDLLRQNGGNAPLCRIS